MNKRPYFSSKFQDLEAAFITSKGDQSVLKELQHELQHRKTPKAKKLLSQIEAFLKKELSASSLSIQPDQLSKEPAVSQKTSSSSLPDLSNASVPPPSEVVSPNKYLKPIEGSDDPEDSYVSDTQRPSLFSLIRAPGTSGLPEPFGTIYDEEFKLTSAEDADILDKYIEAISVLVRDIKKSGQGQKRYELENGSLVESTLEGFLYSFIFSGDAQLFEDADVSVEVPGSSTEGSIVSIDGNKILLSLKGNIGSFLKKAVIVIDSTALLETLKDRLEKVKAGQLQINRAYSDFVTGLTNDLPVLPDAPINTDFRSPKLNQEQLDAVKKAVSLTVSRIWGPPGCGKTFVLSEIINLFFRSGGRILITSNTNKAVDQVLVKLCEGLGPDSDSLIKGSVLRVGTISDDFLSTKYGHLITLDSIIERKSEILLKRKHELTGFIDSLEVSIKEKRALVVSFDKCEELEKRVTTSRDDLDKLQGQLERKYKDLQSLDQELESLKEEREGKSQGIIKRLFPRTAEQIESDYKTKNKTRDDRFVVYQRDLSKHETDKSVCDRLLSELVTLSNSLTGHDLSSIKREIEKVESEKAPYLSELKDIEQSLAQTKTSVFSDAKIVGITCTKSYILAKEIGRFDLIVIDEATMVLTPVLWLLAGFSKGRVVISGDPSQLPSIVSSKKKALLDLFSKEVIKVEPAEHRTDLHEQFRMHPDICSLISKEMYGGRLISSPVTQRDSPRFFNSQITVIDTSELWPFESTNAFFSRFNLMHALLVRNFCWDLQRRSFFSSDVEKIFGVTTPYSAQAKIISKLLSAESLLGRVSCGTVHRFQGDEYNSILIDIPESFGGSFGVGQLIQGSAPDSIGAKLLNVAVSRAQKNLVFLANLTYLDKKLPSLSFLRFLLYQAQTTGSVVKAKEILALRPIEKDLDGLIGRVNLDLNATTFGLFDQHTFDPAFLSDVAAAKSSIVIFSGFVTPQRVSFLGETLRRKISEGVKIRCVTRPPKYNGSISPEDGKSALDLLESGCGCVVDLRNRIHQKVVIIDSRIVWHGSLNILSSSNSSDESMTRIVNEDLAKVLAAQMSKKRGSSEILAANIAEAENPRCEIDGCRTIYAEGRFGPYFYSETTGSDNKPHWSSGLNNLNKSPRTQSEAQSDLSKTGPACPKCNSSTILRSGRFGFFYSCPKYPSCDGVIKIKRESKGTSKKKFVKKK